jgi:hypothetical protein
LSIGIYLSEFLGGPSIWSSNAVIGAKKIIVPNHRGCMWCAPSRTVHILRKAPVVRFFPLVHYELGFLRIAILALAREQQKDASAIQCEAQPYEKRPKENVVLH